MFFVLAKTLGKLLYPGTLLLVLLMLGAAALALSRLVRRGRAWLVRAGVAVPILVALAWGGATLSQLGKRGLYSLEQRYPAPHLTANDRPIAGIIILGGGLNTAVSAQIGRPTLGRSGDRLAAGLALARRFHRVPVVYTAGSGKLADGPRGADYAAEWFTALGLPPQRLVLERQARNTWENAVATRELVGDRRDGHWLLVTSASHMPRALGSFVAAGWRKLIPYPVGHRVAQRPTGLGAQPSQTLSRLDDVVHERLGRLAYRLTGRWQDPADHL